MKLLLVLYINRLHAEELEGQPANTELELEETWNWEEACTGKGVNYCCTFFKIGTLHTDKNLTH
jgi:hypothetical protein